MNISETTGCFFQLLALCKYISLHSSPSSWPADRLSDPWETWSFSFASGLCSFIFLLGFVMEHSRRWWLHIGCTKIFQTAKWQIPQKWPILTPQKQRPQKKTFPEWTSWVSLLIHFFHCGRLTISPSTTFWIGWKKYFIEGEKDIFLTRLHPQEQVLVIGNIFLNRLRHKWKRLYEKERYFLDPSSPSGANLGQRRHLFE